MAGDSLTGLVLQLLPKCELSGRRPAGIIWEDRIDEQVRMRMVALIEAWVVLLASVAASGPLATGPSVRPPGTPGASTHKPTCTWDYAPDHPSLLAYQIMRKEGSESQQGTKPGKITAAGPALGVKEDPSCAHSAESSVAIAAVVPQRSLLSLSCLLIV
jgi:hypothetical protein